MTVRQINGRFRTVVDVMDAVVQAHPEREAFVDGDRRLTFAAWDRAADGVAAQLAEWGVGKGDVVCVVLPSGVDYAIAYQAALRLGAITSGINPRLGPREVASILERTQPRVTITDATWTSPAGAAAGRIATPAQLREAGDASSSRARPRLDPGDPVAIVWTSGTTGVPKGAVFDHDNLAAVAEGAGVLSEPGDRRLSPLPFAHVGYMTRVWDELVHVITTVVTPTPWRAADALRVIEQERVTVGQGVPAQWSLVLRDPAFDATDVSSLRIAATGAAPVPPELVREMRDRLGCPVVVRYTSTEASLTTGTRVGDPDDVVAETVGRASEGVELQVVDDDGVPCAAGAVGVVRCRSGAVMRGYWRDPARTAEVLDQDGWLTTGDLGRLDADGCLILVGRRSEMYVRGGYNVYPVEVETVLAEHPAVERAAVLGAPDAVLGEIGVAFVVAADGAQPDSDELRSWCRARLADYKAPDRVELRDALPLTSMLKVDKQALAASLQEVR